MEDMLLRTVQMLEAHSLIELLPVDVWEWYHSRQMADQQQQDAQRTESQKFFEKGVKQWKE